RNSECWLSCFDGSSLSRHKNLARQISSAITNAKMEMPIICSCRAGDVDQADRVAEQLVDQLKGGASTLLDNK
ncbi:hypothetical protein AVEN_141439-1, partial [Araneus ventricosus]